jgi:hypothetical protein
MFKKTDLDYLLNLFLYKCEDLFSDRLLLIEFASLYRAYFILYVYDNIRKLNLKTSNRSVSN